jgi:hypothetical protein
VFDALVAAVPPMVNCASCAATVWVHAIEPADVIDDPPLGLPALTTPGVDVTPRLDKPLSPERLLTPMLTVFAAPVAPELINKCDPSVPVTTVAVTPMPALLIALAIPLRLSSFDVIFNATDLPPTETVNVPVPRPAACALVNAPDERVCCCAICVTLTGYDPSTAPAPAVAVKPLPLAVAVKADWSKPLKSGANAVCNCDS